MRILTIEELIAMAWSTTAIACLFTLGRFAIHWRKSKKLRWDDIFNGIAVLFLLAFAGTYQVYGPPEYEKELYHMGLLDEPPELSESNVRQNRKFNSANSLIFWCVIYSVKASFLALYWNIFEISTGFRIAWACTTVYVVLSFGITFMWSFWICGEPKDFENLPKCGQVSGSRVEVMLIAWCVLDLFGDMLLVTLPIVMLKPLLMKRAQKVELAIVFGFVLINVVFEILRTVYSISVDLQNFPDQNVLWVFLQAAISVIVCALPCYRGLLSRKKTGPSSTMSRFGSGSSEFVGAWSRYMTSTSQSQNLVEARSPTRKEGLVVTPSTV